MHVLNLIVVPLIARILLVVLFPFSAFDKVVHWNAAMKQADSSFLPHALNPPLLVVAIVVEFVTPVLIVIDWHQRLAAFVLALFCVITALLYHPFWKFPNFWSGEDSKGRAHFWDFLKNLGLVGGLLLIIIGAQLAPASTVIKHPLTSGPFAATPSVSAQPPH